MALLEDGNSTYFIQLPQHTTKHITHSTQLKIIQHNRDNLWTYIKAYIWNSESDGTIVAVKMNSRVEFAHVWSCSTSGKAVHRGRCFLDIRAPRRWRPAVVLVICRFDYCSCLSVLSLLAYWWYMISHNILLLQQKVDREDWSYRWTQTKGKGTGRPRGGPRGPRTENQGPRKQTWSFGSWVQLKLGGERIQTLLWIVVGKFDCCYLSFSGNDGLYLRTFYSCLKPIDEWGSRPRRPRRWSRPRRLRRWSRPRDT